MKHRKRKRIIKLVFVNLVLILVCVLTFVPILYAFSVSVNEQNSLLSSDFSFIPKKMTFENYRKVFTEEPVIMWFQNSLFLAVSTVVISLGTGIPAAYIFSRRKFPGRNMILQLLILLYAFPSLLP